MTECEAGRHVPDPNPCPRPMFTFVPLTQNTGIFLCEQHARHLEVQR